MNQVGNIINLGFGLVLLWLLFYMGWRPYRLDRVREELFEIRNELFLYAAEGNISFSDQAYSKLRDRINALIRFAETITFTRVLIFAFQESRSPNPAFAKSQHEWEGVLRSSSPENKAKIGELDNKVRKTLAVHLIKGSPLLVLVVPFYLVARLFRGSSQLKSKECEEIGFVKDLRVELIEEQAVLAQKEEKYELAHAGA